MLETGADAHVTLLGGWQLSAQSFWDSGSIYNPWVSRSPMFIPAIQRGKYQGLFGVFMGQAQKGHTALQPTFSHHRWVTWAHRIVGDTGEGIQQHAGRRGEQGHGWASCTSAGGGMHLPPGSTFAPCPIKRVINFHVLESHVTLFNLSSEVDGLQRINFFRMSSPDPGPGGE